MHGNIESGKNPEPHRRQQWKTNKRCDAQDENEKVNGPVGKVAAMAVAFTLGHLRRLQWKIPKKMR